MRESRSEKPGGKIRNTKGEALALADGRYRTTICNLDVFNNERSLRCWRYRRNTEIVLARGS